MALSQGQDRQGTAMYSDLPVPPGNTLRRLGGERPKRKALLVPVAPLLVMGNVKSLGKSESESRFPVSVWVGRGASARGPQAPEWGVKVAPVLGVKKLPKYVDLTRSINALHRIPSCSY